MIHLCDKLSYKLVLGNVYPHDPFVIIPQWNALYIMSKIQNGDIIIIHDRPWTISLLQIILPQLKEKGYQVTTISELVRSSLLEENQNQ